MGWLHFDPDPTYVLICIRVQDTGLKRKYYPVCTKHSVTGINEITADNYVRVYPNPLQTGNWQLEVSADWIGTGIADLYDASGKAVYHTEIKSSKTELMVNLAQGFYLLKITGNGQSMVKKLVKM